MTENFRKRYDELQYRVKSLQDEKVRNTKEIDSITKEVDRLTKARWIITEAQRISQTRLKDRVESLITLAVQSVFGSWASFKLEFEQKRNKMECRPVIMDGKNEMDLEADMGGSMVDIISFAFRVVLWSLEKPKTRAVMVLDEPLKNMGKMIDLGGEILKTISHKLGFQLLINTHSDELAEVGDRVYRVKHLRPSKNYSEVELVK